MPWFKTESEKIADGLESVHDEVLRIARQLESHAEVAPYPQVAERLKEISGAEEDNARALGDRLIALGRQPGPNRHGALRSGRNSWERLVIDLEDYRALLRQLSQLWIRWDDEQPAVAQVVRHVLDSATRNRDSLNDLVARADPHAID